MHYEVLTRQTLMYGCMPFSMLRVAISRDIIVKRNLTPACRLKLFLGLICIVSDCLRTIAYMRPYGKPNLSKLLNRLDDLVHCTQVFVRLLSRRDNALRLHSSRLDNLKTTYRSSCCQDDFRFFKSSLERLQIFKSSRKRLQILTD